MCTSRFWHMISYVIISHFEFLWSSEYGFRYVLRSFVNYDRTVGLSCCPSRRLGVHQYTKAPFLAPPVPFVELQGLVESQRTRIGPTSLPRPLRQWCNGARRSYCGASVYANHLALPVQLSLQTCRWCLTLSPAVGLHVPAKFQGQLSDLTTGAGSR